MTPYQYPFIDFNKLNDLLSEKVVVSEDKLAVMYKHLGGQFLAPQVMNGNVMGICSIGGFPVHLGENGTLQIGKSEYTIEELKELLYETVGMSSFMSYLNPKNKSLNEIANTTLKMGHYSVLHTVNISVLICGITSGVEHELSSQRDIMHLSRLTVAKTKSQNNPCIVLKDKRHLKLYNEVLYATQTIMNSNPVENNEVRNLLFPSAKASAIMLTGSVKNFMKLIALKDAGGKEDELIDILTNLENLLSAVFPEVFKSID